MPKFATLCKVTRLKIALDEAEIISVPRDTRKAAPASKDSVKSPNQKK
ncbi:MAG: hypothetical protein RLZZ234_621 [Candidatus Parcubacteria bacterium]